MNASTVIIILVLAVIAVLTVRSYIRKLASGCCGSSDSVGKVRAADGNAKNYPYHRTATIDGMVCQNCARRVENAFNSQDGFMAKANVEKKCAEIYGKKPLEDAFIRSTVSQAGYAVTAIREG